MLEMWNQQTGIHMMTGLIKHSRGDRRASEAFLCIVTSDTPWPHSQTHHYLHIDDRDEPVTPNERRTWMASLNGAGMFTHCEEEGEM